MKPDPNDSGPYAAAYRAGYNANGPEDNPYEDDTDFIGKQLSATWMKGLIAKLDSKRRLATLRKMKQQYEAEDPQDGTEFDLDVIAAIDALIKKYSNL